MSNKIISVLGVFAAGFGLLAATTQGCGGSSGGASAADIASVCNKSCMTTVKCVGGFITMDDCVKQCTAGAKDSAGAACKNADAIVSKAKQCADMTDCAALQACFATIPNCDNGSAGSNGTGTAGHAGTSGAGTAGTTGGAGSGGAAGFTGAGGFGGLVGTAGTAGSTCDTACTKADSCCQAINAATNAGQTCTFLTDCNSANAGADKMDAVSNCNLELQVSAAFGASQPAACK